MKCKAMAVTPVCITLASGKKVNAVAHYEYGENASGEILKANTRFTDASGDNVYVYGTDFKVVNVGGCCDGIDTTLTEVHGTGNIPAGFKSVTITNADDATTINGGHPIGPDTVVSISFGTDRSSCVNELLPAYVLSGGSPQWIGHK